MTYLKLVSCADSFVSSYILKYLPLSLLTFVHTDVFSCLYMCAFRVLGLARSARSKRDTLEKELPPVARDGDPNLVADATLPPPCRVSSSPSRRVADAESGPPSSQVRATPPTPQRSRLSAMSPLASPSTPERSKSRAQIFGLGMGGTTAMFVSSPQGSRAASYAKVSTNAQKTPSIWVACEDKFKRTSSAVTIEPAAASNTDEPLRPPLLKAVTKVSDSYTSTPILVSKAEASVPFSQDSSFPSRSTETENRFVRGKSRSLGTRRLRSPPPPPSPPPVDSSLDQPRAVGNLDGAVVSGALATTFASIAANANLPYCQAARESSTSPPLSTAALARVGLQLRVPIELARADSGSSVWDDGYAGAVVESRRRSPQRVGEPKNRTRGDKKRGSPHALPGVSLCTGVESRGAGREAEQQSTPDSLVSESSSFGESLRRSISTRSNCSELSIDSSDSAGQAFTKDPIAQRRRAALIAAAQTAMLSNTEPDHARNSARVGSLNISPIVGSGQHVVPSRRSSAPDLASLARVDKQWAQTNPNPLDSPLRSDRRGVNGAVSVAVFRSHRIPPSVHASSTACMGSKEAAAAVVVNARSFQTCGAKSALAGALTALLPIPAIDPSASERGIEPGRSNPGTSSASSGDLPPALPSPFPPLEINRSLDGDEARATPSGSDIMHDCAASRPMSQQDGGSSIRPQPSDDDMVAVQPRLKRSADGPPPAEMGALGCSLSCELCGAAENRGEARSKSPPTGCAQVTAEGVGPVPGDGGEMKFLRCSRCRRGCCGDCFRRLPVYCRGPRVVVPGVCL